MKKSAFNRPAGFLKKIRNGDTTLEVKENQREFKSDLNIILGGVYKSDKQSISKCNIKIFYKAPKKVINLLDDYYTSAFVAKYKSIHGEAK